MSAYQSRKEYSHLIMKYILGTIKRIFGGFEIKVNRKEKKKILKEKSLRKLITEDVHIMSLQLNRIRTSLSRKMKVEFYF